jgi:hypothetical protein
MTHEVARFVSIALLVLACAAGSPAAVQGAEVELLTHQTAWRVLTVTAATLNPDKDGKFQPQTLEQAKFNPPLTAAETSTTTKEK